MDHVRPPSAPVGTPQVFDTLPSRELLHAHRRTAAAAATASSFSLRSRDDDDGDVAYSSCNSSPRLLGGTPGISQASAGGGGGGGSGLSMSPPLNYPTGGAEGSAGMQSEDAGRGSSVGVLSWGDGDARQGAPVAMR